MGRIERVALVIVVLGALHSIVQAARHLPAPYQRSYVEGIVLNSGASLARGEPLYPTVAPDSERYTFTVYGPTLYGALAAATRVFGISFTVARLFSLLGGILVAALVAALLRHWTGSGRIALLFGALFLASPGVWEWLPLVRPDLPGIALALAGLLVFARWPERAWLTAPFFAVAILTKSNLLSAPAACFAALLVRRDWRGAAFLTAATAAIGFAVAAWLMLSSDGGYAFHAFGLHQARFEWIRVVVGLGQTWAMHLPLLLLVGTLARARPYAPAAVVSLAYFAASTLLTTTIGRVGFDLNHLLEWIAVTCLCAGLGYAAASERVRRLSLVGTMVLVGTTMLSAAVPDERWTGCREAYDWIARHPGERILAENVGALALAGKPVLINEPFVYGTLVSKGLWTDAPLVRRVREREFDAIVVAGDVDYLKEMTRGGTASEARWSMGFAEALEASYEPVARFACTGAAVAFEPR